MKDRELLELAAKAAGMPPPYDGHGVLTAWIPGADPHSEYGHWWDPIADNGDLYRLAKACKISIDFEDCTAWRRMTNHHLIQEFWGGDHGEEAHAIVRAAAEIGRAMP